MILIHFPQGSLITLLSIILNIVGIASNKQLEKILLFSFVTLCVNEEQADEYKQKHVDLSSVLQSITVFIQYTTLTTVSPVLHACSTVKYNLVSIQPSRANHGRAFV